MSRVGVRETIRRYSNRIGLTKYWAEEVVTAWNMTHQFWLDESGEVTVNTSKRLERFCDFIKANEYLPIKAIDEKYCLKHNVPFITEDKKKVYLRLASDSDALDKAKVIIQNLLDSFFAVEGDQARELEAVKEARKFLKEA